MNLIRHTTVAALRLLHSQLREVKSMIQIELSRRKGDMRNQDNLKGLLTLKNDIKSQIKNLS